MTVEADIIKTRQDIQKLNRQKAKFTDRGDPSAVDFDKNDFTTDNTWRDLDLSDIVPPGTKMVLCHLEMDHASAAVALRFKEKGNANDINIFEVRQQVANVIQMVDFTVPVNTDGIIQYKHSNVSWSTINLTIRKWWT